MTFVRENVQGSKNKEYVAKLSGPSVDTFEVVGAKTAGGGLVQLLTNDAEGGFVDVFGFKTKRDFSPSLGGRILLADLVLDKIRVNKNRHGIDKSGQRKSEGFPGDEGGGVTKALNVNELLVFDFQDDGFRASSATLHVQIASPDSTPDHFDGKFLLLEPVNSPDGYEIVGLVPFSVAIDTTGLGTLSEVLDPSTAVGITANSGESGRVGISFLAQEAGLVCDLTACGDSRCDGATFGSTSCGVGACAGNSGILTCQGLALIDTCDAFAGSATVDATCDDVDDDCDGLVDEDYAAGSTSCGVGACERTGTRSCVAGNEQDDCTPAPPTSATDSTCNLVDDDCDGATDEEYASLATQCGTGVCSAAGATSCVLGAVLDSCTPGTPLSSTDATCDGVDDNCSGTADENYVSGQSTSCGVGACRVTVPVVCQGGVVVSSCTPRNPISSADTTCDGVDDDCDGLTDEDGFCSGLGFPLAACTGPSFAGRNLDGTDFSGRLDLDCADFTNASLERTNFSDASLENADFSHSSLRSASLARANIKHAVFVEADLSEANLTNADARGASFVKADLSYAETFGAELNDADLSQADLTGFR